MSTEILNNLDGRTYLPTSEVINLAADTDLDKVSISLLCENGVDGTPETFFDAELYAYNGIVVLSNVGSLVEEYFRLRSKTSDVVTIKIDDAETDIHFLYCEYKQPEDWAADGKLFLASNVQRVHSDSLLTFAAYDRGSAYPLTIKAVGPAQLTGKIEALTYTVGDDYTNEAIGLPVATILSRIATYFDDYQMDVRYFALEHGGAQKMYYLSKDPGYLTFVFRNGFNVKEYLDVVGTMITKSTTEAETAVCNGKLTQYNRVNSREYEVTTIALLPSEVKAFIQMLGSYDVALFDTSGHEYPVIITDYTCEESSDDETLNTIKFTWRFASQRPRSFDSPINGIIRTPLNVFSSEFSKEYD